MSTIHSRWIVVTVVVYPIEDSSRIGSVHFSFKIILYSLHKSTTIVESIFGKDAHNLKPNRAWFNILKLQ